MNARSIPSSSSAWTNFPRWLVLVSLVLAPWPYACIPPWTQPVFSGGILGITIVWAIGWGLRRKTPALAPLLIVCVALLLTQGWFLIGNAQYSYDRLNLTFVPVRPWVSGKWIPGALDTVDALPAMMRITGLLGVLCVVADMARHDAWLKRLIRTILLSGVSVIAYGIVQRILNQPIFLWQQADMSHNLFGSFYYHGNAGAFVNLLIPILIGWVALDFTTDQAPWKQAFGVAALLLAFAAAVAIASKAAMLVTGLLAVSAGLFVLRKLSKEKALLATKQSRILLTASLFLGLVGAAFFGWERAFQRWHSFVSELHGNSPRLAAWQACLRILPDAGPWGVGPGNFQIVFPHYTHGLAGVAGVWEHAHQDVLETWIEWGWFGLLVWGVLILGAFRNAFRPDPTKEDVSSRTQVERLCIALAVAGVLVHGLVDFPLQIPAIQLYVVALLGVLWRR